MSGHSKWATIKRAKGKNDAARGKIFNRLIREITIAARLDGGDRDANPRLRSAIAGARAQNMPGKNIETAIKKGTGELEGVAYEEVVFEGYGPGGVAMLVEVMTDNRNRTVAEVRHVLTKAGGSLGSSNSVNWMFSTRGVITADKDAGDEDTLLELVLEAGADDMTADENGYEITTSPEKFESVRDALAKTGITPSSAELAKVPANTVRVEGENAMKVMKLIDALDELDDVQHVYSNADFTDEDVERYNAQ